MIGNVTLQSSGMLKTGLYGDIVRLRRDCHAGCPPRPHPLQHRNRGAYNVLDEPQKQSVLKLSLQYEISGVIRELPAKGDLQGITAREHTR